MKEYRMKTKHAVEKTLKNKVVRRLFFFFSRIQVQKFDEVMAHEGNLQIVRSSFQGVNQPFFIL